MECEAWVCAGGSLERETESFSALSAGWVSRAALRTALLSST